MGFRAVFIATTFGALIINSAVAQGCHCADDKARDLAAAQKLLDDLHNRKPMGTPAPLFHSTPRLAGGGGPMIHAPVQKSELNSSEKK